LAEEKKTEIPPATVLDVIGRYFSRRDLLLEYLAKTDAEMLEWLKALARAWGVSPIVIPPVVIPPIIPTIPPTVPGIPPELRVIPKPTGSIVQPGSLATPTTTYTTVASYTPSKDKRFRLAKITVSCSEDIIVQVTWKGEAVTIPYYVMAKLPFTDWFPIDYYLVTHDEYFKGDGNTKLELKAKIPSGGTAAEVNGEIVGEEV